MRKLYTLFSSKNNLFALFMPYFDKPGLGSHLLGRLGESPASKCLEIRRACHRYAPRNNCFRGFVFLRLPSCDSRGAEVNIYADSRPAPRASRRKSDRQAGGYAL